MDYANLVRELDPKSYIKHSFGIWAVLTEENTTLGTSTESAEKAWQSAYYFLIDN